MLLRISHTTRYHYDRPVHYALQEIRLQPKSRAGQRILRWETLIEGGAKQVQFDDQHNNHVTLVSFEEGASEITIRCSGEVETSETHGVVGEHGGYAPLWYFLRQTPLTRPGPNLRKLVREFQGGSHSSDIARMHALSAAVLSAVRYDKGRTDAETPAEAVVEAGHGVCQDHAHVFIGACRLMNIPARYVSGYLLLEGGDDQEAGHAWAEAHLDHVGWVGFDISNGISPDERYVRVATGLDYKEAAPVSGMRFGESGEAMTVTVQVQQ